MNSKTQTYSWPEVREKVIKGVTYAQGCPFNYRYQLRIKLSDGMLYYTFWDFSKCLHSGAFSGTETAVWEDLLQVLSKHKIMDLPCVSVSVSLWSESPMLLRPENSTTVALDVVNRALRSQPTSIRKDLQEHGIYCFTAMEFDEAKMLIFGLPVGFTLKGNLCKLPKDWARVVWYGPLAFALWHASAKDLGKNVYHTVLLKNATISLMTQDGRLRFLQQDRALCENEAISQSSINRLRSVYGYFPAEEINHYLHPVNVSLVWADTLRGCIQGFSTGANVQITASPKLTFPGIEENVLVHDMFPSGLPWAK